MAKSKAQSVIITDDDGLYYERCAGIDVHKKLLVVCLRIGRRTESVWHYHSRNTRDCRVANIQWLPDGRNGEYRLFLETTLQHF